MVLNGKGKMLFLLISCMFLGNRGERYDIRAFSLNYIKFTINLQYIRKLYKELLYRLLYPNVSLDLLKIFE
jgi:hypothetical protein